MILGQPWTFEEQPVTETPQSDGPASARHAADPSIGELVAEASTSFSTLIRGELDLAKLELTASVKKGVAGIVFFIVAAFVALFSLTFLFIAIAEVLARYVMPRWAGFLTVFGLLIVVAGLAVFIGIRQVKRVRAPERTIATTKDTMAYLKEHTGRG
jgi:uncharacterized membrane protein YqjE